MRSPLLPVRVLAFALSLAGLLGFAHRSKTPPRVGSAGREPQAAALSAPPLATSLTGSSAVQTPDPTFSELPALRFVNRNSGASAEVRLYDDAGGIDEQAALRLDALLGDTRDPKNCETHTLDRRTLQLAVRAALHFQVRELWVVSAYRKPGRRREGPHASGKALDFQLPGVNARSLAAYLRALPRVGVGIYTHPKTAFVHLDDREHSFHWLDASPPGRHWREMSLGGGVDMSWRDARYVRADDWPEGTIAPPEARE